MGRMQIAVIGVGHLGKEHARILSGFPDVELVGVVDANAEQAQSVARRCGSAAYSEYWPLLNRVDAAVIAVPTMHHHLIAEDFLRRGIPLLIEKPMASTLEQANALVAIADEQGVPLQVGHIERFNPAFEELAHRPLRPKFVQCERFGLFSGRSLDIGVVLDLMIHDLDLLLALDPGPLQSVEAVGVALFGKHEDVAHARLRFANGCLANLSVSRANALPRRCMQVWSPEGYASVDFARRSLTLVQPSPHFRERGLDARKLDSAGMALFKNEMFSRHLQVLTLDCNQGDQLTRELQQFVHCVRTGERPRVSGVDGQAAIALAAQVLQSMQTHRWEGHADGPVGPSHIPEPLGMLFQPAQNEAAA